jgi:hypothetical protein
MHTRDEWNSCLDDGMNFDDFYPNWRNTELWEQWRKVLLQNRCVISSPTSITLIDIPEDDQNAVNAHAKSIKTPIEITTDAHGEPEIPLTTQGSGFHTKVVQKAV